MIGGGGYDDNGDHDDAYDDDSADADDDAIGMGARRHHRVARASLRQIALSARRTVPRAGASRRVRSKTWDQGTTMVVSRSHHSRAEQGCVAAASQMWRSADRVS